MRTTNKCFKEQIQGHIFNILNEEYGDTPQEQLQAVVDGFKNWYGPYEQRMNPNRQEAFKSWSMGLPSELNIEYTHYGMEETVKSWFAACDETYKEPKDDSKTHDLYLNLVYREFRNLCDKNDIKLY